VNTAEIEMRREQRDGVPMIVGFLREIYRAANKPARECSQRKIGALAMANRR
jgi:hypothetical protein